MRISDKLRIITKPWVIAVFLIWSASGFLSWFAAAGHIRNIAKEKECTKIRSEITRLTELKVKLTVHQAQFTIEDERISAILNGFMSAGKKTNIGIGEIKIGEESERDGYKSLPVTVTIHGDYNQIGHFINTIEREQGRYLIQGIELSTKETKGAGIIGKIIGEYINL